MTEPRPPAPRHATIRQAVATALRQGEYSAHDLSRLVGIPEKAVAGHLEHLAKSLPAHGERLTVTSPKCLACGYAFPDRMRLTRPSRCPQCRGTHLAGPVFRIVR
ncbi:MAG: transcriptional regulator [Desulfuromonas sp.]|nr:transcriptional regulator [Desulfuromonas sp.]